MKHGRVKASAILVAAVASSVLLGAGSQSAAFQGPVGYFARAYVPGHFGSSSRIVVRPEGLTGHTVTELVIEAGCSAFDIPVPAGGFRVNADLTEAILDVPTPCGFLHAEWDAIEDQPDGLFIESGWVERPTFAVSSLHPPAGSLHGDLYFGSPQLHDLLWDFPPV